MPENSYNLQDYQFELPPERIAQKPAGRRGTSRLLVKQQGKQSSHQRFHQLPESLQKGDVLVLNQTKVMKARCIAIKETGTRIEVLILKLQVDPTEVPVLFRPAKRVKVGTRLKFEKAQLTAEVTSRGEQGQGTLSFADRDALHHAIESDGQLPLPPYIKREHGPDKEDENRYQTVYAKELGAVAAPTAGLHFTQDLLNQLQQQGIITCYVTHHVGIGTFKPLLVEDIRNHQMGAETYTIGEETARQLNQAKKQGRRIIAVGTTTTRCLEANYRDGFHAGTDTTNHFIYPGYCFRAIAGLITNFHLPGTSLLLLVSALMGRESIQSLYQEALARNYQFYSYGDAMLLLSREKSI